MGTTPKPKPDAGRGKILSTALLALALLVSLVTFSPFADAGGHGGSGNNGGGGGNTLQCYTETSATQYKYKKETFKTEYEYHKETRIRYKNVKQGKYGQYSWGEWSDWTVWQPESIKWSTQNKAVLEGPAPHGSGGSGKHSWERYYRYVPTGESRQISTGWIYSDWEDSERNGDNLDGWVLANTRTNPKSTKTPIDCPEAELIIEPTCDALGEVNKSTSEFYTWNEALNEDGTTTFTASPVANLGVKFSATVQTSWTFNLAQLTGEQCNKKVTPAAPTLASEPSCTADGIVNAVETDEYSWAISGPVTARVYTATAKPGVTLQGQTSWTFNLAQLTGQQCHQPPEPTSRTAVQETLSCETEQWTIVTTSYKTPYVWSDEVGEYVPGDEVQDGEPVTTYRDATYGELVEEGCTYLVQPSKTWDFGEGNSVPSDGEARVTITAGELSKTWRFNTQGEMLGDEDAKAPLEVPMGTEYEVSETFTNPSGWSCEMLELPVPVAANPYVEKVYVSNRCTIVTIPTIPEQPTTSTVPPTTSTTEEVGGIDEEPTTTTEAPTTTEPEVLDTVVTPTTVGKQTLPRTGSNTTTVLSLAGALLTAGAAFVLFGRRRFNAGN